MNTTFNPTAVRVFLTSLLVLAVAGSLVRMIEGDDTPDAVIAIFVTGVCIAVIGAMGAIVWMIWS